MKAFGKSLFFISLIFGIIMIVCEISANYKYDKNIKSYWKLADKSSTIEQKSIHINTFVQKLNESELSGTHDAVFLKTPDNSFDKNLEALKSLQQRLEEIKTLDPNSFEYNTAIDQITGQEQGEASQMLSVFKGCWTKEHYLFLWNWVAGILTLVICLSFIASFIILLTEL